MCASAPRGAAACHASPDTDPRRRFYYHAESQKTAWEAPAGARVQRAESASAGSSAGGLRATDGSTMILTVLALGVPVLILFGGLLVIYYQASREGLHEMLKNLKQKRDRSMKRKGERPLPFDPAGRIYVIGAHPAPARIAWQARRRGQSTRPSSSSRRTARAAARPTHKGGGRGCRSFVGSCVGVRSCVFGLHIFQFLEYSSRKRFLESGEPQAGRRPLGRFTLHTSFVILYKIRRTCNRCPPSSLIIFS